MDLKKGNFVRIKDAEVLMEINNPLNIDVCGILTSDLMEEDMFTIDLDAASIELLSDEYLREVVEEDIEKPWEIYVRCDELELAEPRKTKKRKTKVLERLEQKLDALAEILEFEYEIETLEAERIEKEVIAFFHSETCMYLPYKYQKVSKEILFSILPEITRWSRTHNEQEWARRSLDHFFNNVMPQLDAEPVFFEAFGEVLLAFFDFREQIKLGNLPKSAYVYVKNIRDTIPAIAADSSKWNLQKKLKVEARKRGVDWIDLPREVMDKYLKEEKE